MSPWAAQGQRLNQQMYGNYPMQAGSYPNATASGSPMNYGGYYPPTTYGASTAYGATTSGPAYRGGYPSTSGAGGSRSSNAAAGPAYKGPSYNGGYDPALMAAMQNMSFSK
jgi:hypothetical protein